MRAPAMLFVAILASIAGCRETHHCEVGFSYQTGQCRPYGDAASGFDSGADTSVDDAGTDAFDPCAACGDGSVCIAPSDGGDAGHAPGCVECVTDAQCDASALPLPDGGGADGGRPLGAAICETFHCVRGCRGDADCGTSGVCRPDHRCSAYPSYPSTAVVCRACDTDANCDHTPGFLCLPFEYQNGGFVHDGHYCLRHASACNATTAPLANTMPASMPSIDGVAVTDATCAPATSCEGLTDTADARPCSITGDTCGLPGVDDGFCAVATSHCTIRCSNANVCPDSVPNCNGSPAACSP